MVEERALSGDLGRASGGGGGALFCESDEADGIDACPFGHPFPTAGGRDEEG